MSGADLYIEAADILGRVSNKEGTLKRLVLQSHFKNLKVLYALVCKAIQNRASLDGAMTQLGLDQCALYHKNYFLCLCLAYDIIYGEGVGNLSYDSEWDEFAHHCQVHKLRPGSGLNGDNGDSPKPTIVGPPKYLRINTLKTSRHELKQKIIENGFCYARNTYSAARDEYGEYLDVVANRLGAEEFTNDMHMRSVFVFPASTDLHECDFFLSGLGVVQDKASTLVAPVLAPPQNSICVDCCAAPGNKTSHLAALLQNTGKLYAFDRDHKRVNVMRGLLRRRGVTNCHVECRDFLSVDPTDLDEPTRNAEYLLVDPSCSGSGMFWDVGRMLDDVANETSGFPCSADRIGKLANFQAMLLNHALTFPKARRVVYSTCSINEEENEYVVAEVSKRWRGTYRLATVWPEIPSRGRALQGFKDGPKCLRLGPTDLTIGFFVACFERIIYGASSEAMESCNCFHGFSGMCSSGWLASTWATIAGDKGGESWDGNDLYANKANNNSQNMAASNEAAFQQINSRQYVCLDGSRAGDDVVLLKNGLRICGSGVALANAPLVQDKAYFEFRIQTAGDWGVGVAAEQCDPNRVPLGADMFSCVLRSDLCVWNSGRVVCRPSANAAVEEGDVIGVSYDHSELRFYIKDETVGGRCAEPIAAFSGLKGTFYPCAYVANGSTLDAHFGDNQFFLNPPPGFGRVLFEQTLFS